MIPNTDPFSWLSHCTNGHERSASNTEFHGGNPVCLTCSGAAADPLGVAVTIAEGLGLPVDEVRS